MYFINTLNPIQSIIHKKKNKNIFAYKQITLICSNFRTEFNLHNVQRISTPLSYRRINNSQNENLPGKTIVGEIKR